MTGLSAQANNGSPAKLTETSDHDRVSSADSISEEGSEWETTETTDGLDGVEETKGTTLWVAEVVLPGIKDPEDVSTEKLRRNAGLTEDRSSYYHRNHFRLRRG